MQMNTSMPLVLTLVLSLFKLVSGQWQVIGPDKHVKASVGKDAIFSCFISPEMNAEAMEVRFFRNELSAVVHLYSDGQDLIYMQMPAYRGRTELLKDSIVDGHVSLRLRDITPSDAGLYGCWFSSQTYYQEATWELQVSALGSTPIVSIMEYVDGEIQLCCQSLGWFPQPTVKWKGPQGHDLPSDSKVNANKQGLFDVETYLMVQENARNLSCCIQNVDQNLMVESKIWIGETFFQPSPWRLPTILLGSLCFGLCISIIGWIIFFFKYNRKHKAELGEVQAELEKYQAELEEHQAELDWRKQQPQAEWRDARKYPVEVTLDPNTAHPQLYISSDLRTVTYMAVPQTVPISGRRFKNMAVVASQGFSEGKHYWEVDVGQKVGWCLGVCLDDIDRTMENMIMSPNNGYWVIGKNIGNQYFSLNPDTIYFSPRTPPTRVGIFLDYEGGTIFFFNINDQTLIFTMTHQFTGLLRPYVHYKPAFGGHETSIIFCPVYWRSGGETHLQRVPTFPDTYNIEPPLQADSIDSSLQATIPFLTKSDAQKGSGFPLAFSLRKFLSRATQQPTEMASI
ncbi:butyrophilin-like protein 3 [Dasypus novemcinctus]|uniref:butyrophilin-like protein 3 n=1 Tax=Dasypus novemcinctus TaxID=9361 RepID=UPI00265E7017|nr:butyrophilin-like protein 3 [Dasypus novemcinctus]